MTASMTFRPIFQTLRSPALSRAMAETGWHCYEACVASIYGDEHGFTPDELPANWVSKPESLYWSDLDAFMAERGLVKWWQPADTWPRSGGWWPAGYSILTGRSARNPQLFHSVVCFDGELAHDPMPGGRGVGWPHSWGLWLPATADGTPPVAPVCNWFNDWQPERPSDQRARAAA